MSLVTWESASVRSSLRSRKLGVRFEPHLLPAPKKDTTQWVVSFFGAGDEARTRYLDLGKVALYQMSYARKRKDDYSAHIAICQPRIFKIYSPLSRTSTMPASPSAG